MRMAASTAQRACCGATAGDSGPAAAGAQAPQCPPRRPADRAHVAAAQPAELVCLDTFYIGQLKVVGKVWQVTACDAASSFGIACILPALSPTAPARALRDVAASTVNTNPNLDRLGGRPPN